MQEFWVFLSDLENLSLFIKLLLGAIAVFFATLAWRRTNESYMLFFILGIFFYYLGVLYKTIQHFGFIGGEVISVKALSIAFTVLENIPVLCFIIAFILFIRSKKF